MSRWNHKAIDIVDASEDTDPDVVIAEEAERRVRVVEGKSARQRIEDLKDEKTDEPLR